jgi:alkylation response protein AidB-like acyl-CoA dehydrogenase
MMRFDLSPEQQALKDTARRFATEEIIPVAARFDEEQTFPADIARKAWELGLMNFEIPAELGGAGLGVLDTGLVLRRIRLHEGVSGREAHARREAAADLRRDEPGATHRHCTEPAQRMS